MDNEIKTLLRLSQNPHFKLLPEEEARLNEWKAQQEAIEPKVVRKKRAPKGHVTLDEMGAGETSTVVAKDSLGEVSEEAKKVEEKVKKTVKNVVKTEIKEIGETDES